MFYHALVGVEIVCNSFDESLRRRSSVSYTVSRSLAVVEKNKFRKIKKGLEQETLSIATPSNLFWSPEDQETRKRGKIARIAWSELGETSGLINAFTRKVDFPKISQGYGQFVGFVKGTLTNPLQPTGVLEGLEWLEKIELIHFYKERHSRFSGWESKREESSILIGAVYHIHQVDYNTVLTHDSHIIRDSLSLLRQSNIAHANQEK